MPGSVSVFLKQTLMKGAWTVEISESNQPLTDAVGMRGGGVRFFRDLFAAGSDDSSKY